VSTSREYSVAGMVGVAVLACGLAACGPDERGTEGTSGEVPSASRTSPGGDSASEGGSPSATGTLATGTLATGTVAPGTETWQRVHVSARSRSDGRVALTYTVRGISSRYQTWGTDDPVPVDAGPRNTRVFLDGRMVGGSDGGAITCREGTELQRYRERWPWSRLPVVVAAGRHRVVVKAPYCVDGHLVPSVGRTTVFVG